MARVLKITATIALLVLLVGYVGLRLIAAPMADRTMNKQVAHRPYSLNADAAVLHQSLLVMDWHADTLLWERDLLAHNDQGHVDLRRLQAGNVGLQMFTTVTKTPRGQNLSTNDASSDNITLLAIGQGWPIRTWGSLLERALYQAEKLDGAIERSRGGMMWVRTQAELQQYLDARATQSSGTPLGALLGTEGAHPLEGDIANIDRMYDAGFRMVGLVHFFDNQLGGSLHGTGKGGLTDFGKQVVERLEEREIIIDLAHSSEQVAWDTLKIATRPVVVSHTGFRGHCSTPRNFPDNLMQAIAGKGGLIAVGFWDKAACGDTPDDIAASIAYGIDLIGADHVVLGSDWDGTVKAITAADTGAITQALMKRGVSEDVIRMVMGQNSIRFLSDWLPKGQ
ncbi:MULTISPECIES: dipeptidase [Kordiimonas]|jgi:microsomal dipeptidase-like Zn-dependent dipeptidase|uniref:dipeptidase n=1 Tax=Kordiimonas TaxID=288021 RepID=UPI002579FFBE|nr:membrane dipeptidase [Kordiimonas sp. UBA4487]